MQSAVIQQNQSVTRQLHGFIRATHAGPTFVVTIATSALALAAGRGVGTVWVAAAVLAGQCSVGWSNDALDAERDRRVRRDAKPIVANLVSRRQIAVASVAAFTLCVPLSLLSGWRAAAVHLIAVLSAIAYNAGVKSTVLSPLPYAISFALLPAFVTLGSAHHAWPSPLVMLATATIGVGAHMVNAVADIDDDEHNGVRGLPQRIGPRASLDTGAFLLLGAGTIVALRSAHHAVAYFVVSLEGVACVAVLISGSRDRLRTAWRLTMVCALLCLAVFIIGGNSLVTA